ncbi:MAG TPA: tetratricopeptide repeat protein, partial [Thermomicrobiales bacterium]|nr:tetratricopeptide repeat protein [Thermomicrobiales bacterium]
AVDRQGDLYVADAGNDRIQQLSPTGEPLAQWGSAGAGPGQFAEPAALALDAGGDVYVADTDNGRVQKLSPAGAPLAVWAHRRPSAADPDTYVAPAGVAVGGRGDVYVLDGDDGTIQELAPDGEPVAELGAGRFDQPGAIAVDAAGALYVADSESGQVRRLAPDGTLDAGWRAAARAGDLAGLAADGRGRVYVADDAADAIAVYAPSGAPLARWGAPRPATATPSAATSGWWPAAGGPAWFPDPTGLYEWGIAALVLGGLLDAAAWRFALGESRGARARYLALALGGWPRLLLRDRWLIPANACLAAHVVGLPGLSWLEALVRRLCRRGAAEAGVAAAFGYDCLRGRGRSPEEAGAWLDRLLPALRAGGVETVHRAFGGLHRSGHRRGAHALLARGLADARPAELAPLTANNLAYSLLRIGRPDAALAFARAAAAGAPDSPYPHGTLGATLLALGEPAEAEAALRESLRRRDDPGNRLELARTLAAQSRYVEAMTEAERALREHTGPWREDEAGPEAVESWLAAWRAAAAPAETPA